LAEPYHGRLELTWTNKDQSLLAHEDGSYEWVPPTDYRVAEVRLLRDAGEVGEPSPIAPNLLIRGDALSALNSIREIPAYAERYVGKVRLAYLDPPFNTQQSFLQYDDALEHSVWLTMMRDRLLQVRDLLAPDGSIWVHCDDYEQARLRVVMDEVFGPSRFVATVIWRSTDNSNNDAKQFSQDHNYILVYGREPDWRTNGLARTESQTAHYTNPDDDPRGPWFDGNPVDSPNPRENLRYDVVAPNGNVISPPANGWRWRRETLEARLATGEIRFSDDGTRLIRRTYLADQGVLPPSTMWDDIDVTGSNRQAKYELKRLFDLPSAQLFDTPKPERLMKRIIELATDEGDIVLDCFLGSGTTAAVAHKMRRRWVGIERGFDTLERFAIPRLAAVVGGQDLGGVTSAVGWAGGGGFAVRDIGLSMFDDDEGVVVLADWAINNALAEATAAQLGFAYETAAPFCGRKGRSRLAVVDGLISPAVIELLVGALGDDELVTVCGTSIDPDAADALRAARPGSRLRKIPASLLSEYEEATRRLPQLPQADVQRIPPAVPLEPSVQT